MSLQCAEGLHLGAFHWNQWNNSWMRTTHLYRQFLRSHWFMVIAHQTQCPDRCLCKWNTLTLSYHYLLRNIVRTSWSVCSGRQSTHHCHTWHQYACIRMQCKVLISLSTECVCVYKWGMSSVKETFRIALLPLLGYPTTSHGVNLHISHYHIASLGTATCIYIRPWMAHSISPEVSTSGPD